MLLEPMEGPVLLMPWMPAVVGSSTRDKPLHGKQLHLGLTFQQAEGVERGLDQRQNKLHEGAASGTKSGAAARLHCNWLPSRIATARLRP